MLLFLVLKSIPVTRCVPLPGTAEGWDLRQKCFWKGEGGKVEIAF